MSERKANDAHAFIFAMTVAILLGLAIGLATVYGG